MSDPVVAEIRKAREEFARKFNYDFDLMCDDLQRRQKESGARLVSMPRRQPIVIPLATEKRNASNESATKPNQAFTPD